MNRLCPLDPLTSSEPQQAAVHSWTLILPSIQWCEHPTWFSTGSKRGSMCLYIFSHKEMYKNIQSHSWSLSCSERQKKKYCECSWRLCTHCFDQYFWKQYNLYVRYCCKFVMSIIKVLFFCFDCIPLNIQYN